MSRKARTRNTKIAAKYKREAPRHRHNPFLSEEKERATEVMPINPETFVGYTNKVLEVGTLQKADPLLVIANQKAVSEEKFLAVYLQKVSYTLGLSKAAQKIFHYILTQLRIEDYTVVLAAEQGCAAYEITRSTYERAINVLLFRKVIAKSTFHNVYFVNPLFLCHEDRFAVSTQYLRTKQPPSP